MKLDEFKTEWLAKTQALEDTQMLQMNVLKKMTEEKSQSKIEILKKRSLALAFIFGLELLLFAAIFLGNPFDFKHYWQFLPFVGMSIGVSLALYKMISRYMVLAKHHSNEPVEAFLKRIISFFEKSQKSEKWLGPSFMAIGVSVLFALTSNNMGTDTPMPINKILILLGLMLLSYLAAMKLNIFKNKHIEQFEETLETLKVIQLSGISHKQST